MTVDEAKVVKLNVQERVIELWKEKSGELSQTLDSDCLLQVLEKYAEDELYFEKQVEIEQIEVLIASELNQDMRSQRDLNSTIGKQSLRRALRMSIFTIQEETEQEDDF